MSRSEVSLILHAHAVHTKLPWLDALDPDRVHTIKARFDVVTGITLPDGVRHDNTTQSATRYPLSSQENQFSITLHADKAERLARIFRSLRPHHGLDCHDLVAQVEGKQRQAIAYAAMRLVNPRDIVSGQSYGITVVNSRLEKPTPMHVHGALGTDDQRLLGLLADNEVLNIMEAPMAAAAYAAGYASQFVETRL